MNFDIMENLKWLWNHIWVALKQMGGVAILTIIITFIVHKINTRFEKRIEHKYDEKLEVLKVELDNQRETYRSLMEKKNYISKTRFDTEFAVCKELMLACNNMINAVYYLFPVREFESHYSDEQTKRQVYDQKYGKAIEASNKYNDLIASYAPFIAKELEEEMKELHILCGKNIEGFRFRYESGPNYVEAPSEQRNAIIDECYERTWVIREKLSNVSDTLRQYFKQIEVEEDKGA